MQRYLVTGGTGFVGHALCQRLVRRDAALTVLSRDPARASSRLSGGIRVIGSLDQLEPTEHFDVIINLAGEPIADKRWSANRKRLLEAVRARGKDTSKLLLEAVNHRVQGPKYRGDYKDTEKYGKFQFVKLKVR